MSVAKCFTTMIDITLYIDHLILGGILYQNIHNQYNNLKVINTLNCGKFSQLNFISFIFAVNDYWKPVAMFKATIERKKLAQISDYI
jgi:hypothetical protein